MDNLNTNESKIGEVVLDWTPCQVPELKILVGQYCKLEILNQTHIEELFHVLHLQNSDFNWLYMAYGSFQSLYYFKSWVLQECLRPDPLFYTIFNNKSEIIGMESYLRIQKNRGSIEIGHIHFSNLIQQSTISTESMYLMMKQVFEIGYRRYEWKCNSLNQRSRNAAVRLGFQFEGVFRQAQVVKGRNRDTAWYSILDKEWPAQKIKFERWLDPNNFNQEGNQKKSLHEC